MIIEFKVGVLPCIIKFLSSSIENEGELTFILNDG